MATKQSAAAERPLPVNQATGVPFTLRDIATLTPLMAIVRGAHYEQVLVAGGISAQDYDLVTGDRVWLNPHGNTARRVLDQIVFGVSDGMGFPRIEIPAEYVAMLIALFVNQVNWLAACNLYRSSTPAETLAARGAGAGTLDRVVNPEQLFALVIKYVSACNYLDIVEERRRIGQAFKTGIAAIAGTPQTV